jgi:ABC-2 type transport system ATP-binding protein
MRLIAGLLVPDTGRITVLGMDATQQSLAVQAAIGYMPQRFGLYEDLSVQENLDLYADLQGVSVAERPPRYEQLLAMTGLGAFTSRLAGRLSGGMKQKLGLACTLVRSPQVLLLDEPTVGVDPVSRRELWQIVFGLVRDQGMSVLLSTAYLSEAERCDAIAVLHEGRLLGHGPPASFSEAARGRSFAVDVPGMKKRRVQERLRGQAGVVDAVVQAQYLRVVMQMEEAPNVQAWLPEAAQVRVEPLPPRFEDSFVMMLRGGPARAPAPAADAKQTAATNISGGRPHDGAPVIEVHDLERRFGSFYAVKGISFHVGRGEIFGLLGANGAGKSTTFRMLCGLLPPSGGQLRVVGVDLRHAPAKARARIGYMSQKFSLYGNLSVRQNIEFFSSAYGLGGRRRGARINWVLENFELVPWADATSAQMPLGFKQRLAMACALMHEPEVLFLDEPTSGVDPLARREFWSRINDLADAGVTVMVTTHFMEEAEYCDRLAIMAGGRILTVGTPADIRAHARSPQRPQPTVEDAFIQLVEADQGQRGGA